MNGSDQELNIVIKAKDQASKTLESVAGKVEKIGPNFKKMALIAAGATVAIAAGAYKMVQAYADAEAQTVVSSKRIENTLKSLSATMLDEVTEGATTVATGMKYMEKQMELAGKAAVKLGIDDESAADSFSKLFAITKDVGQANKELSLAMDLARFKGISLEDATQKLVMVHSGATKELKALGIQVDDTATAEQNLSAIHKQVAGTAEAFASTTAGATERLKVQFDNLKESLGEALAPAFQKVLDIASRLFETLQSFSWDEFKDRLGKLLDLIDEKTLLITAFKEAWNNIATTFRENLLPALQQLWEALKPLEPVLILLAKLVGGILVVAIHLIVKAIEGWVLIITNIIALAVEFGTAVVEHFTKPIQNFIKVVKDAVEWVQRLIDKAAQIGGKAVSGVKKIGSKIGDALGFEHGGTVPGAVGQAVPIIAHGGEEIIPAGRARSGGGGSNIVLNLNYPQFRDQNDINVVKDQINEALRDVIRIHKLQPI